MNHTPPSSFHEGLEIVIAHIIQDFMLFMKRQGLSTPQINALMYIFHAGKCQVSDIAVLADASSAAASQLVERLVQQGLVERQEDPANRRMKIVSLSDKGKELIHSSVHSNRFLQDVMGSLTPDEHETIKSAFNILARTARSNPNNETGKDSSHA
jgi:DNA-binding MarR family transcriptional regulator